MLRFFSTDKRKILQEKTKNSGKEAVQKANPCQMEEGNAFFLPICVILHQDGQTAKGDHGAQKGQRKATCNHLFCAAGDFRKALQQDGTKRRKMGKNAADQPGGNKAQHHVIPDLQQSIYCLLYASGQGQGSGNCRLCRLAWYAQSRQAGTAKMAEIKKDGSFFVLHPLGYGGQEKQRTDDPGEGGIVKRTFCIIHIFLHKPGTAGRAAKEGGKELQGASARQMRAKIQAKRHGRAQRGYQRKGPGLQSLPGGFCCRMRENVQNAKQCAGQHAGEKCHGKTSFFFACRNKRKICTIPAFRQEKGTERRKEKKE